MTLQAQTSFIDPTARLSGDIRLGGLDYIGPYVQVKAENGWRVQLGDEDNLQDNVTLTAATQNVSIGERTSIAHGATLIDTTVGRFVFVGFNAWLENAVLEDGAMVQHGARVIGVTIPKDRVVAPGALIISAVQASQLPRVNPGQAHFKAEVVEVNNEFAAGYPALRAELGESAVVGVSPNPRTSWTPQPVAPLLGEDVEISPEARVIGPVQLGAGSRVGRQSSIRADEGGPIVIGAGAVIGEQVTFHALKDQAIRIGKGVTAGDRVVFHGELSVGERVWVGSDVVLFKTLIGSDVTIGAGAIVIGVSLADGVIVPEAGLILDQAEADALGAAGNNVILVVKAPARTQSAE